MRMYNPPHPGVFLKGEVIDPLKLIITTASKILSVTIPAFGGSRDRPHFSKETSKTLIRDV